MTNGEKYLKDGVDIEEFIRDLYNYSVEYCDKRGCASIMHIDQVIVKNFFEQPVKPTLTADEKVILKKALESGADEILRNNFGILYFHTKPGTKGIFSDLFQFVKPRRRI